jgi:hypothetical protein
MIRDLMPKIKTSRTVRLEAAILDAARIIEGLAPANHYFAAKVRELRALASERKAR